MANKIILALTKAQFNAIFSMIEDNSTLIETADDSFALRNKRHIKITNKALKENNINYQIKY